jgi:hypothetical protein
MVFMNKNAIATQLAELGQEEVRLMRKLVKVQRKRCKLLSDCIPGAGLDDGVVTLAAGPKDPPADD